MQVTKISARWDETVNLGDYSNGKIGSYLEAELEPGDDPEACQAELLARVRTKVQSQVDDLLEQRGHPARYSAEPRYDILTIHRGRDEKSLAIVVPAGAKLEEKTSYYHLHGARLGQALRVASEMDGYEVLDCSDGNLKPAIKVQRKIKKDQEAERQRLEAERQKQHEEYTARREEEYQRELQRRREADPMIQRLARLDLLTPLANQKYLEIQRQEHADPNWMADSDVWLTLEQGESDGIDTRAHTWFAGWRVQHGEATVWAFEEASADNPYSALELLQSYADTWRAGSAAEPEEEEEEEEEE